MNKRVYSASLSIFTTLALISCSQVTPTSNNVSVSSDNYIQQVFKPIIEPINTDTTLKVDSIIPKMFSIKATKLQAGDSIPGRFIIKFKNNEKSDNDNDEVIKSAKAKKLGDIKKSLRMYLIEAEDILNNNVLETLKKNDDVEFIEQDKVRTAEDPGQSSVSGNINVQGINVQNGTTSQSVNIAADTRPTVSFSISNGSGSLSSQGKVGDVFQLNISGTMYTYIVKSNCLEGPALPQGFTCSIGICQATLVPITITMSNGFSGFTLNTYVGAAFYISDGQNQTWYTARSNCIEGPALPQGVTSNLPVCNAPSPTPTATPAPVVTPPPVPTVTPTPAPLQSGRPSYLPPLPTVQPTLAPSGRPGFLPTLPGTSPQPTSSSRPSYLPPLPTAQPTTISSGRPTYLPPLVGTTPIPTITSSPRPSFLPGVPNFTVNDPLRTNQYIITKSKLLEGFAISTGSSDVTVAVIDTGVEGTHEDLAGKMVGGFTAFNGGNAASDPNGHGTHCAGVAAAITNNNLGIVGVAPNARVMPVQVLDSTGAGSDSAVAAGIMYAADSSAKVLSMSLGGPGGSQALQSAVAYAISKGKVIAVAAGNAGNSSVSYPAGYPGVIAVSATDNADQKAVFSQFGSHISVSAPGVSIYSTFRGNGYQYMNGTSMACPAVAGLAALVLGYKPNLTPTQVKSAIENGSDDIGATGFDTYFGYGRINVQKTLAGL